MDDFRLTLQAQRVLAVLLEEPQGKHYGLDISRRVKLPTGSIYPILARLEKVGWVTSELEDIDPTVEGRRPRRYYELTGLGAERAQRAIEETMRAIAPGWGPAGTVIGEAPT
jgi:DNA-binding PadR family transcriptional regulator